MSLDDGGVDNPPNACVTCHLVEVCELPRAEVGQCRETMNDIHGRNVSVFKCSACGFLYRTDRKHVCPPALHKR